MSGKISRAWPKNFCPCRSEWMYWSWTTIHPMAPEKLPTTWPPNYPQIHVLHRTEKNGLGRAYIAGFQWALERNYEFIFEMDCDFSHDPDEIPNFLTAAQKADLVLGSRYTGGVRVLNWPLKRLLLSRCAGVYVWFITGMPFTDPTGGYKCFRRRALQSVRLDVVKSNGYSFQIELTHRLWREGFSVAEVPITFADRVEGTSKLSRAIVIEAFWMVWWLWMQNGFRRSPRRRKTFPAKESGRKQNLPNFQQPLE